ncbi:hypothetical protein GBK04_23480 [Cytophagaceae bacterium SJW1-29]|uniref:SbsA Ig-like domain-containing protein n=1 Tax=Salmonirosea aquatica TaxID=2654236 RepID=A0A7C9FB13_9BACT|nr:hypothetical protein [Cytophagaceae bacterium SJW1-29]
MIFFVFLGTWGCSSSSQKAEIRIQWKGKTAVGVSIPIALAKGVPSDSIPNLLQIKLIGSDSLVSILGNYSVGSDSISFVPLIPFTRGLHYEVRLRNVRMGTFAIPLADAADAPRLLAIFPSQDTLPENLLKIYLHFSQPMQEGKSNEYVFLIKNDSDTVQGAFLNLQPELWNPERTVLTLWLDPGRIKRDLHPNTLLGAPLQKNGRYRIEISSQWKDQQGTPLPQLYTKSFVTSRRDSLSPVPAKWALVPPLGSTTQPLKVDFKESLDHSLITESLRVQDENGQMIRGTWQVGEEEKTAYFKPSETWKAGIYTLSVRTILEDLAGNNLNRPFDRDVTRPNPKVPTDEFMEIPFVIAR